MQVTLGVCLVSYLIGFTFISEAGIYYISVIDGLAVGLTPFVVIMFECFAITFVSNSSCEMAER